MAFEKNKKIRDYKHDNEEKSWSQAPLTYVAEDKVEKTSADFRITYNEETIHEMIPIFENGTAEELLLTVRDFNALCNTYELWESLSVANVYGKFRPCFTGNTRGAWDEIIYEEEKPEEFFTARIIDLFVGELGMDAHKDQVK